MILNTFIEKLFSPIIKSMELRRFPCCQKLLTSILGAIPKTENSLTDDKLGSGVLKSILSVAIIEKKQEQDSIDLVGLIDTIFASNLSKNIILLCDLLVELAIQSPFQLVRIFSCLQLQRLHQNALK
jgi:hypothetical protein